MIDIYQKHPKQLASVNPVTQKATKINLFTWKRPYMRAFHFSWLSFQVAFMGWFAIAPLLPYIQETTKITNDEIDDSQIINVASAVLFRIIVGPLCDRYGPRRIMATLLILGSIPVGLSAFVQNGAGLITVRFFIGILGATFIPCQFWTTQMFDSKLVGTANALVGGWGDMGAGITTVTLSMIADKLVSFGLAPNLSWRVSMIYPTIACFIVGLGNYFLTDDCPQGDWSKRGLPIEQVTIGYNLNDEKDEKNKVFIVYDDEVKQGEVTEYDIKDNEIKDGKDEVKHHDVKVDEDKDYEVKVGYKDDEIKDNAISITDSEKIVVPPVPSYPSAKTFLLTLKNPNVIILILMYASSFGVELAVDGALTLFLFNHTQFDLTKKDAGLIASLFGLMNIFSRATGGILSDVANKRWGIRGRIFIQFVLVFFGGLFLSIFPYTMDSLPEAIAILLTFSYFIQASCGSTFGIVPFVDPKNVGAVSGLIGAGGSIGGAAFSTVFKVYGSSTPMPFTVLGVVVIAMSFSTFLLKVDNKRLITFK